MKRFGTALAVAMAIFAVMGCNDYGNTFQVPTGARISSLSPADVPAGSSDFTLTINGGGFVAKTVAQWNGTTIPTQLQTDSAGNVTGVTATVAAALVAKPGLAYVNTLSPFSGAGNNGLSNSLAFVIDPPANPVPSITSITPAQAPAGSPPLTLTVSGSNFIPAASDPNPCLQAPNTTPCGSQVNWNMGATQSTFSARTQGANVTISPATITLTIPTSNLATSGCAVVTVYNPPSSASSTGAGSGGGTSPNGKTFTVGTATCPTAAAKTLSALAVQAVEETPAVSVDGRYVTYTALQSDHAQVFVRDTCQGAASGCQARTLLVSAAADGTAGNADSGSPSMTSDGRYVAFSSAATNLVADASAGRQIYVRDTCFSAPDASTCKPSTQLVSMDPNGTLVGTEAILPSISASGRFVAFVAVTPSHTKKDLAAQTTSGASSASSAYRQVFVRDTCLAASNCTPKTTRISLQPGEAPTADAKPAGPALSGSASHVALPGATSSTLFTPGIAVDDRVFLALTQKQP
jgi:hypothetical protein